MINVNASTAYHAPTARHKRALRVSRERSGKRLPNRAFISTAKVLDHRCGVLARSK